MTTAADQRRTTTAPRVRVVSLDVHVIDQAAAVELITGWGRERVGRYVCAANVHMVMEAFDAPEFAAVVNCAELVVPDGMPLVWAQRLLGHPRASRSFGPHLTAALLDRAAALALPVAFYGGSEATLRALLAAAARRWPELRVVEAIAPPFRPLTPGEDAEYTRRLAACGAGLVFAGIGCPRQERWMADHVARIPAVLLGVGLAFDVLAGVRREPPMVLQRAGLGWVYRLAKEPRRLWRRYLRNNPRFMWQLWLSWLRHRREHRRRG